MITVNPAIGFILDVATFDGIEIDWPDYMEETEFIMLQQVTNQVIAQTPESEKYFSMIADLFG